MSAVLLAVTADDLPGQAIYVAVRPGDAIGLAATAANGGLGAALRAVGGPVDDLRLTTVPWAALPGIEPAASAELAESAPGTILTIGTVADGEWASWYPGGVPPDPP
jgi:hypothetical protein